MVIKHIELKTANEFVSKYHRHHKPVLGHRYSIGCYENDDLVGVAIIGRPVARNIDQIMTVEILRLCTNGSRNACSKLYSACRKSAKALGYERIITYILETENGSSLLASGYSYVYTTKGGSWDRSARRRKDEAPIIPKKLFEVVL